METDHEAEIAARLKTVTARAYRSLTDDELALVRQRIQRDFEHRQEMRAFPLSNGDAPAAGFNSGIAQDGGVPW